MTANFPSTESALNLHTNAVTLTCQWYCQIPKLYHIPKKYSGYPSFITGSSGFDYQ